VEICGNLREIEEKGTNFFSNLKFVENWGSLESFGKFGWFFGVAAFEEVLVKD
jgi:hypothetical protein